MRTAQIRVIEWVTEVFGEDSLYNLHERCCRFVEEALELAQAVGLDPWTVIDLVARVYSRPPGDPTKELGGALVALRALAGGLNINSNGAENWEIERIHTFSREELLSRYNAKVAEGVAGHPVIVDPAQIQELNFLIYAGRERGDSPGPVKTRVTGTSEATGIIDGLRALTTAIRRVELFRPRKD